MTISYLLYKSIAEKHEKIAKIQKNNFLNYESYEPSFEDVKDFTFKRGNYSFLYSLDFEKVDYKGLCLLDKNEVVASFISSTSVIIDLSKVLIITGKDTYNKTYNEETLKDFLLYIEKVYFEFDALRVKLYFEENITKNTIEEVLFLNSLVSI